MAHKPFMNSVHSVFLVLSVGLAASLACASLGDISKDIGMPSQNDWWRGDRCMA
jgi:hypothetical protein